MSKHLNAQAWSKNKANARISASTFYWQRTALKTLLRKRTRDSNLLPYNTLYPKGSHPYKNDNDENQNKMGQR